ncbi:MAG: gluconate 2-dehydrogenase subunit 3 family protein [Geminicoccaceae bacterium]|nr:gluconate 2-dehydrogenase subunit 3 family protein [Geminicoccaceae bacterium]
MSRFQPPYPGYDVLAKWDTPSWNDPTRRVVAERLTRVPERRFFDPHEWATLHAVCDRLIPQPDRLEPVPIAPFIDDKLHRHQSDGWREESMPRMEDAWRRFLKGIDEAAQARYGRPFVDLGPEWRDLVLRAVQKREAEGGAWGDMDQKTFFEKSLLREAAGIYYAHPAAWSEIGFGGPASPRGYVRLVADRRDPWEAPLEREDEA